MKSSLFVSLCSVFLMAWLVVSFVTTLKPEPRLGRGSLPLSAKVSEPKAPVYEDASALLAAEDDRVAGQ
jgi:hypothetical protein